MLIRMKALTPFGVPGVNEGHVKRGREFLAGNEQRCKELEAHGLAYRIDAPAAGQRAEGSVVEPDNEASEQGPFVSAGGEIGAAETAPLSPQGRRRRQRRSDSSEDGFLS